LREVQATGLLPQADVRPAVALIHQKDFASARDLVDQHLEVADASVVVPVVTALFAKGHTKDAVALLLRGIDAR
jgi:hypothetical protein